MVAFFRAPQKNKIHQHSRPLIGQHAGRDCKYSARASRNLCQKIHAPTGIGYAFGANAQGPPPIIKKKKRLSTSVSREKERPGQLGSDKAAQTLYMIQGRSLQTLQSRRHKRAHPLGMQAKLHQKNRSPTANPRGPQTKKLGVLG